MPLCAAVSIHHGPYESSGVVQHRTERLQGMTTVLTKQGHQVEYKPIKDWNAVELWVNGEQVFKCDIRDLDYGGDGQLDNLCAQALQAVEKAF